MITRNFLYLSVFLITGGAALSTSDSDGTCENEFREFRVSLEDLKDESKLHEIWMRFEKYLTANTGDITIKTTISSNDVMPETKTTTLEHDVRLSNVSTTTLGLKTENEASPTLSTSTLTDNVTSDATTSPASEVAPSDTIATASDDDVIRSSAATEARDCDWQTEDGVYPSCLPEKCEITMEDGTCAWIKIQDDKDMNLYSAEKICACHNSIVAKIQSKGDYEKVLENLQRKIPNGQQNIWMWMKQSFKSFDDEVDYQSDFRGQSSNNFFNMKIGIDQQISENLDASPTKDFHSILCECNNLPTDFIGQRNEQKSFNDFSCDISETGVRCFWIAIDLSRNYTYNEAKEKCERSGGAIASILRRNDFEKIIDKLCSKMESANLTRLRAWIGHKFNTLTNVTTYPGPDAFVQWTKRQPAVNGTTDSNKTAVYLVVKSADKSDSGMANQDPNRKREGVVCERSVPAQGSQHFHENGSGQNLN